MAANALKFFAVLSRLERMTEKDQKKPQETTLKRDRKSKENRQRQRPFQKVAKRQIKHLIYAAKLQLFGEITKEKCHYFQAF